MPYAIRSLFTTRKDPHRRGHKDPFIARGRVQLGSKRLKGGQRIFVTDEWYEAHKTHIEKYLAVGAISVSPINGGSSKKGAPGNAAPAAEAPKEAAPKAAPVEKAEEPAAEPVKEAAPEEPKAEAKAEEPAEEKPAPAKKPAAKKAPAKRSRKPKAEK